MFFGRNDVRSLYFAVTRLSMKLFATGYFIFIFIHQKNGRKEK